MAGLLDSLNNPLMGMAIGLLSGANPGGTLAGGAQQGLLNMQGMAQAAQQGQLMKAKLDEIEQEKQRREANRADMQGLLGYAGNAPADGMGPVMPGAGLLGSTETAGLGRILQALPDDVQGQFLGNYALQAMAPAEDRTPADLLALQQAFGPEAGMQKWLEIKRPASNNTVINNIPKPDFGYTYIDPNDPSKGVTVVPGSGVDTKRQDAQKEKDVAFNTYNTAMSGLKDALSLTDTGPVVGNIPAFTAAQQSADGAIAATAPVLKQLFRSAGEGVFTDKDQEMLIKMVPTRTDLPEARISKLANIDAIVRAKLGVKGAPTDTNVNTDVDSLVNKYAK